MPNLTPEQIQRLENFIKSLQQFYFKMLRQKAQIEAEYLALIKDQQISFDIFWQRMEEANIPTLRPENFQSMETWDQIMWIQANGLSVAWKLITELKDPNA